MSIKERLLEFMSSDDYKPMLKEELLVRFDIPIEFRKEFFRVLKELEKEGTIIRSKNDKYGKVDKDYLVVGSLQGHERGFGFVIPDDKDLPDVYIPAESMNGAMDGDKVVSNVIKRSQGGRKQEGEIIRILERANKFIVGTFEDSKNFGFLLPDNQKLFYDVFIPKGRVNRAKNGQKVVVEVTKWPERRRNPEGKVVEVLGYPDEAGTDVLSIIRQFDLPEEFPKKVKYFTESIKDHVSEEEINGRRDLRDLKTFTIDGADAKDLDDAISIEKLENGNYKLGVHIADVAHYVKKGTPLDKESYKRGNSVYLVDRVIPMLPKELSNGICSLNPDVDRLCLSVLMEIDKKGKVVAHEIIESVINSDKRLVYEDVSNYLEADDEQAKMKLYSVLDELKLMEELMNILKAGREERGSIDFNFPETQIILDDSGIPIEIKKADRRIANRMIEEFMLITNETVAEQFYWADIPFLYRIHEIPDAEKIAEFNRFIYNLGYIIKGKEIHPKDLQKLTEEIEGKKEELVISTMMLRSLKKARYSMDQNVHFGLAADYYSHFTAPIRRYPDLTIHRIIKDFINGGINLTKQDMLKGNLPDIAEHTSKTERVAEEAEREVEDLKMTQYMSERIGEEYEGIISSLTNFGMFVQLPNTVEGLVPFSQMIDDYYQFDEENLQIIGERTKKVYNLGDKVKIEVVGVDISRRNIDFQLIE